MGKSYIEREALKRVYMGKGKDKLRLATVINELELAPAADVVEVVRCKDCVYYTSYDRACTYENGMILGVNKGEGYCSYGERRVTL